MKDCGRRYTSLDKGFTLIELMISLSLLMLVLGGLMQSFYFQYNAYENTYADVSATENLRFFAIHIEKQVRETPMIYVVDDRVYLKDLETPKYYNYYEHTGEFLYKIKTNQSLQDIGLGEKSQMIDQIERFSLTYVEPETVRLDLEILSNGQSRRLQKDMAITGQVTVIN